MLGVVKPRNIDRTGWAKGEWDNEVVDRLDWVCSGYVCRVARNDLGVWCGYVGIPKNHPAYQKKFSDIEVRIHGGLTYSGTDTSQNIWWLGFNCGHGWDIIPAFKNEEDELKTLSKISLKRGWASYKSIGYAIKETRHLAEQLKEIE